MQFRTRKNGQVFPLGEGPKQRHYTDSGYMVVHREGYEAHHDGHVEHIEPTTFRVDRERSKKEKWFQDEENLEGWHKDQTAAERHRELDKAAKKHTWAETFHTLLGIANVSRDKETAEKARADYRWVQEEHGKELHRSLVAEHR